MNLTTIDKNRITVAVFFTVVMLLLVFVSSGRSEGETGGAAPSTTVDGLDTGLYTDPNALVDAPASLDGPSAAEANGGGAIAYPAEQTGNVARGTASFKRYPQGGERGCSTNLVPLAAKIRVRNLNNGRTTTCTNVNIGLLPGGFEIVLDMTVFETIAELIDAPLPVEITW